MKKLLIAAALLVATQVNAAMPCQWQSNYGYIKFITPSPYWNSVRIGLTNGQTLASTSGTFNLPLPPNDVGKLELFQQTMDLLKDANSRGVMVSIETTGDTCYKASALPTVAFVTTQIWFK